MSRTMSALLALFGLLLNLHTSGAQERSTVNGLPVKTVKAGETRDTVDVTNQYLEIQGHVRGDIHATNSTVVIKRGAKVDGAIHLHGGTVQDQSENPAHIVTANSENPKPVVTGNPIRPLSENTQEAAPEIIPAPVVGSSLSLTQTVGNMDSSGSPRPSHKDWFGQQFALLLLGLLGGLVIRLFAPRAASRVAEQARLEPARCLLVGGASAIALGALMLVNALIMNTPVRVLWTPVCLLVVFATLSLLGYGWLCGMRYVGDCLAPQHSRTQGAFYRRMAMGLSVFFLANILLGGVSPGLGNLGLLTQFAVALVGLGAAIVTRGGRNPGSIADRLADNRSRERL